jgi:PAS domain S-box-containing protein
LIAQASDRKTFVSFSADGTAPHRGASPAALGYLLAASAVAGALALRLAFDSLWGERLPFAWFFLAVLVVARFAGTGPQVCTLMAGLALGDWFFLQPRHSFQIAERVDQLNAIIFICLGTMVMVVSAGARRMVGRELAARDRIAGILECTSDAVCTLNRNWEVTYFNKRASDLAKIEAAHVLGRNAWTLWPNLAGTRFETEFRRIMADRETVHFEECHPAHRNWIEVHACPYGDGIAVFFRDVSNRKRAESSRAQLAAIVESSDDAIIGQSVEGLIVSWNAAAERLYGYTEAEAIGRSFGMLFPIERSHELVPILDRVQKGERVNHFETKQQTRDGAPVDVSLTISPVQTKDLRLVGISITARDVSDRKRQEAERERLIQELQAAMAEVKTLSGLLPICAQCKKIRDDGGYWNQIEKFIGERSHARFTHGICPDCLRHLYPELK